MRKSLWKVSGSILLAGVVIAGVIAVAPLFPQLTTGATGFYNGITEVWVDDDFTPDTPGWGMTHFASIQAGIDAVSGSTVNVAAGTYYENITLVDGVELLGAGANVTTIDGGGVGSVVTASSVGSETIIDGFTITNGNTGILLGFSSITISNNTITQNHADDDGGGMRIEGGFPRIINNNIINNTTTNRGGGIKAENCTIEFIDNILTDNTAQNMGGGLWFLSCSGIISSNTISNNSGGMVVGGGIYLGPYSSPIVSNNIITYNTGGGIMFDYSDANVVNNIIQGNSGRDAIYKMGLEYPTITNNTITDNTGVGIHCDDESTTSHTHIVNCIIWGNEDDLQDCAANYSCVSEEDAGPVIKTGLFIDSEGNISLDPLFVPAVNDYHLQSDSPCIDAGTNTGAINEDIEGTPRPLDGDGDMLAVTDMGAYEYIFGPPEVTLDDNTISASAMYTITFQVTDEVPNNSTGEIVIEFPVGTTLPLFGNGDISVTSTAGFGTANAVTAILAANVDEIDETVIIRLADLTNPIGEYAMVQVELDGVYNPDIPGDYTLFAETSEESTAVESEVYEIVIPDIVGVPGIISVYNPGGIIMSIHTGNTAMADALLAAGEDYTIVVGPGTYNGLGLDSFIITQDGLSIEANLTATDTFWMGGGVVIDGDNEDPLTSDSDGVLEDITITGITFDGEGVTVDEVSGFLIQDCVFEKDTAASETLLILGETDGSNVTNCDFDTTYDTQNDTCIHVMDADWTITDCDFLLDEADIDIYNDY